MPRPSIDESLAAEIRRIHRETQRNSAGSFQEALDTVVQLALTQAGLERQTYDESTGWYPGKYAGKVYDRLVGESSSTQRSETSSSGSKSLSTGGLIPNRSPDDTAVFKARLGADRTITFPEPETAALSLDTDDIIQLYAYQVETETTDDR
jgi:hypothetical protein